MPAAPILPYEDLAAPRNWWDVAFEVVLATLLAFSPFALGAVEAWSELVVVGLAALLSMGLAIRVVVDRGYRLVWTWLYAPLALFLALATLQLLPLGEAWVQTASPPTDAFRKQLLGDDYAPAAGRTISLYPLATEHDLRMTLVFAAVLATVANVYATPAQVKRLLGWVLIVGTAQAVLALLQIFTFADGIYWALPTGSSVTSGSFFNYSNFSQFMNLSIGAGLALILIGLHEGQRGGREHAIGLAELHEHAGVIAALVVCGIAVLTSLSRNGAISLLVSAALVGTGLLARGTLSRRGWLLAVVPLATLAVLLLSAFDVVYERLATLQEGAALADRWELTRGVLAAWRQFPLWGAGLGTHAIVFPGFDPTGTPVLARHADNDYAQLLEETGVLGAVVLAIFVVLAGGATVRLCRRGRTPLSSAAFGLAFGLAAVAIHSATDFGQHLPAVFCLTAVTCGLIVPISRWERRAGANVGAGLSADRTLVRRLGGAMALVALSGIWYWATTSAAAAFQAESWRGVALLFDDRIQRAMRAGVDDADLEQEYGDMLNASEQACTSEPGNVEYLYWLNAYRWQALSRSLEESDDGATLDPDALPLVERVADSLTEARRLGPTYGPAYALEGQLRLTMLSDEQGRELIDLGVRLAPYDPVACLTAGEIAAFEGRADDAAALLERAVALYPSYYRLAAAALVSTLDRPDLAERLAAGVPSRLTALAELTAANEKHAQLAEGFRQAAEAALRAHAARGEASDRELAALAALDAGQGRHEQAVELYRRALVSDYKQVAWHLALARSLAALGRTDEALGEAKICLRLRPRHRAAEELVAALQATAPAER